MPAAMRPIRRRRDVGRCAPRVAAGASANAATAIWAVDRAMPASIDARRARPYARGSFCTPGSGSRRSATAATVRTAA